MGQFDLETGAALEQLNFEELSTTPGGEFAGIISDLVALVATGSPWGVVGGASNILLKVRKLAGASYASNLIYVITAVGNDLATLYQRVEHLRKRIEMLPTDPKFAEAVSALALRAMQTSVKDRLKRLARIVVNGVKEDDLEPESLDEMMRAAVELTTSDLAVLRFISSRQIDLVTRSYKAPIYGWPQEWLSEVQKRWQLGLKERSTVFTPMDFNAGHWRSSLSRLQAHGFIASVQPNPTTNSPAEEPYALLPSGQEFLVRVAEVHAGN